MYLSNSFRINKILSEWIKHLNKAMTLVFDQNSLPLFTIGGRGAQQKALGNPGFV